MVFGTVSDPLLALALWTGCGAFATAAVLLIAVAVMRFRLVREQRREKALAARWRPLFAQCAERVPEILPGVSYAEGRAFLTLWCRAQESLRGEAQARLVELAKRAGARKLARRLLRKGKPPADLLAIIVLGHLRDEAVVPLLERLLLEGGSVASLYAAQALLRIHPDRALRNILLTAARREDWPLARVSVVLGEADPAAVAPLLCEALDATLEAGRPEVTARLVRLHGSAHAELMRPAILRVLASNAGAEALAAGLSALWHPADAEVARRLAAHEAWVVRVAAVRALSRLGTQADAGRLAALLGDSSWWVRYRAAQALCALPGMDAAALEALRAGLADRFAADMLAQALAERGA